MPIFACDCSQSNFSLYNCTIFAIAFKIAQARNVILEFVQIKLQWTLGQRTSAKSLMFLISFSGS